MVRHDPLVEGAIRSLLPSDLPNPGVALLPPAAGAGVEPKLNPPPAGAGAPPPDGAGGEPKLNPPPAGAGAPKLNPPPAAGAGAGVFPPEKLYAIVLIVLETRLRINTCSQACVFVLSTR